ncbi:MAG: SDR family oxidoreductase [Proteobacteria bacterium]|nr:SDR family oxidoreductase [Pseudomonadota bacterium]
MSIYGDKTAIVTGGGSGIGRALCENLGREGAFVVVADVNAESAGHVAAKIEQDGGRAEAVRLDVTVEPEVRKLIEDTAREHDRLDYVFNNAGIGIGGEVRDMNLDHWRRIVDVNLWGVIYGTLAAYRVMIEQGSGHIVNTASSAALIPAPLLAAYGTTKHAVLGLSTSLRCEGAGLGVRVSVVCPGFIDTAIFDKTEYVRSSKERVWSNLPSFIRMMPADDCARVILQGVARNKGVIPVQGITHVLWWINRLSPRLLARNLLKSVEAYRSGARQAQ